jgi:hypothetical protein
MKRIFFCLCCLISINSLAQTPVEQVKERLEHAKTSNSFEYSSDFLWFDYKNTITESELDTIFEIHKKYYGITEDSYRRILPGMMTIYELSKNPTLQGEAIYFILQAVNDSIIDYPIRHMVSEYVKRVDLHIFDKKMQNEILKNLNFTYKNDMQNMLDKNMILLAGALNMKELKDRLQVIADSSSIYSNCKNAARVALCRMGDKKNLKEYFAELNKMRLKDVLSRYAEIEYIKQKESVELLLKVLYSEETEPAIKETWSDEKLAYYAIQAIERISKNCPFKVQNIYSNERNKYLAAMRKWAKKNEIIINRNIW